MDEVLPIDLCKICHNSAPKYCCPRCFTRTCSLFCSKRHKKWAQCNGIRDPTRYLKRADLATPAGIDHDYNFLTGIERGLDRAERDAEQRGVVLDSADERELGWKNRGFHGPAKGEAKLKAAMEKCKAVVMKAPPGMVRAKQNKTYWHRKKKTIIWTVEWVLNNGNSQLGTCPANLPIADAYAAHFNPRSPKKRKLSHSPSPSRLASDDPVNLPPSKPSDTPIISTKPPLHYYLLRPNTPAPTRILVPLLPASTLDAFLSDRPVLEFPVIYVLRYEPEKLPTGFMTEKEYFAKGTEEFENNGTRRFPVGELFKGNTFGDGEGMLETRSEGLDGEKVVEVLKKDFGSFSAQPAPQHT